jgi:hypothetical protein
MFEILPITMTVTDWTKFVAGANRMIARSPTRGLDAASMDVGTPASFIPALLEFTSKGSDPRLRGSGVDRVLEHMSFGFLVSTSSEILKCITIDCEGLKVLIAEPGRHKENYIVSGTLKAWKTAIIHFCTDGTNVEGREFFNSMWDFFNKMGFSEVFGGYRRKDLKDNTWILEAKKQ